MTPPLPSSSDPASRTSGWGRGTAAKIFLVMMLALLPLATIATIANIRFMRTSDQGKRELLQTATRQNAGQLAYDIAAIRTSQGMVARVLATDPDPGNICERLGTLFLTMGGKDGISLLMLDRTGTVRCASGVNMPSLGRYRAAAMPGSGAVLAPELNSIVIRSASRDGAVTALTAYRLSALRRLAGTNIYDPDQRTLLRMGEREVLISGTPTKGGSSAGRLSASAPVGNTGIEMVAAIDGEGSFPSRLLSIAMPLALLFGVAFVGWLVTRRMLIRPLIVLQREVAAYSPGEIIHASPVRRLASAEIVALGQAFQDMSEDVAEHEEEMRQALDRQTRLTREVHHRVKNNLQIISSLISLHWRAAEDAQSATAYLSIQRRVDALAVVQRHHYAELDEKRGVRARPMMNEIAASLKASAQIQSGRTLDIAVDCDDVHLHQDIAAPLAFMTAELADIVIEHGNGEPFRISLVRTGSAPLHARFTLAAPAFRTGKAGAGEAGNTAALYERVLIGLARQLRTPLEHDGASGEYHVIVPIMA